MIFALKIKDLSRAVRKRAAFFRSGALILPFLAVFLVSLCAAAIVTQSDGTVIPQSWGGGIVCVDGGHEVPRVQQCLNEAEGLGDCDSVNIHYQIEADIWPQVFYPTEELELVFTVWGEGAGYHNVFGWYPVDDPSQKHVDVGCRGFNGSECSGPENTNSCGGGTNRTVVSALADAGVDMNTAIGFFLINPIRISDNDNLNCSDSDPGFCDGSGFDTNYIFYTQRELNDDGDFKHFVVYRSPSKPDTYYFGFEDLFRGGDNDFEDMFVEVSGIRGPCVPSPEQCNNEDDDCDGETDEDLERPCGTSCLDGGVIACIPDVNANDFLDHCEGVEICSAGIWGSCSAPTGSNEVCNGIDDDCNGIVDDGNPDGGAPCMLIPGNPGDPVDGGVDWVCHRGIWTCSYGSMICVDEVGPGDELCNGLDDDCNGTIDDGVPAGGDCYEEGMCGTGTLECVDGGYECVGDDEATDEVCNGKDDDCDGEIDDGNPGGGLPCLEIPDNPGDPPAGPDAGTWPCRHGQTLCLNGEIVCVNEVGPSNEVCDAVDNDCDGQTDEDYEEQYSDEHPECIEGELALPCQEGEFPCPSGKICNEEEYCVDDPCIDVVCEENEECEGGQCVDLCESVQCADGYVCVKGDCLEDNCYGLGCDSEDEICVDGECIQDQCLGVECPAGQFCREGACIKSCKGVECPSGMECRDGECITDACAGILCEQGFVCKQGVCTPDPCTGVTCGSGRRCVEGDCVHDPCTDIECPEGQYCSLDGQCGYTPGIPTPPPESPEEQRVLATGSTPFCSTAPVGSSGNSRRLPALLAVMAFFIVLIIRRSIRLLLQVFAVLMCAVLSAGCDIEPYCMNCEQSDSGADDPHRIDTPGSSSGEGEEGCRKTGPEVCDGEDNDCDGYTDEDFSFEDDPLNCGDCGIKCEPANAIGECRDSRCRIRVCDPQYVDLDGEYDNGCEYECHETNGGVELCDNVDNDCDTLTDEDFDLMTDPFNCGVCNHICAVNNAVAGCESGECVLLECNEDFYDRDKVDDNGCEVGCTKTNGGVEACDGLDNDCDGKVDEGFAFDSDPDNCGGCGIKCEYLNAQGLCDEGTCTMGDCIGNFANPDGLESTGCEYSCTVTNLGIEDCDDEDNDCDGWTDEGGDSCTLIAMNPGDPPAGKSWLCRSGVSRCEGSVLKCDGEIGPQEELCDGIDNDCNGFIDSEDLASGCAANGPAEILLDDSPNPWDFHSDVADLAVIPDAGADGGQIHAVYHDTRDQFIDGGRLRSAAQITGAFSGDLGQNWTRQCNGEAECQIDQLPGDDRLNASLHPSAASVRSAAGQVYVYVAWEQYDRINLDNADARRMVYFARSLDQGSNWTIIGDGASELYDPDENCASGTRDVFNISVAADAEGRVVVVWEDMCVSGDQVNHYVRSKYSEDFGGTWSSTATVNSAGDNAAEPVMSGDSDGRFVVVWQDARGDSSSIFADCLDFSTSSPDWSATDLRLDGDGGRSEKVAVAAKNGMAVLAWQDDRITGDDSLGKIYSRNVNLASLTAGTEQRMDIEPVSWIYGYPSRDPAVVFATASMVAVAWSDERHGLADVFMQISDDGGDTWLSYPLRVEADAAGYNASDRPVMVKGHSHLFVIWEDGRNGNLDLYYNYSLDLDSFIDVFQPVDFRLDSDTPGLNDSQQPVAKASGHMIHVVWQDSRGLSLDPPNTNAGIYYRSIIEE